MYGISPISFGCTLEISHPFLLMVMAFVCRVSLQLFSFHFTSIITSLLNVFLLIPVEMLYGLVGRYTHLHQLNHCECSCSVSYIISYTAYDPK